MRLMQEATGKRNLWQEYVVLLGQLKDLVQSQSELLKQRDWEKMAKLYAKKENNILALQRIWHQLSEKHGDRLFYSEEAVAFRDKARSIILMIREIEKHNERMILDAMRSIKDQIGAAKGAKRHLAQYIGNSKDGRDSRVNKFS